MLALGDYHPAVQGERPPQARAIDPDGTSLREECELVARARLITTLAIAGAMVVAGIVLTRLGNRRQKPMDDLRPLPKRE